MKIQHTPQQMILRNTNQVAQTQNPNGNPEIAGDTFELSAEELQSAGPLKFDNSPVAEPASTGKGLAKWGLAAAGVAALAAVGLPTLASAAEPVAGVAASEAVGVAGGLAKSANIGAWLPIVGLGISAGMLFLMWRNSQRMSGGGDGDVGSISGHKFDWVKSVDKRFTDVAGIPEAKRELMEAVEFLKTPDRFTKLGAKMPRGVLLDGPPGTGKTLLAEAVAGEAGLPFVKVDGSEFVEKYVGVGAARIRSLFAQARQMASRPNPNDPNGPRGAIIFIDEIDAIGRARNGESNNRESESTLNQMLTEMSGFEDDDNILVIAATNRPELLDSALTRSGRFDRKVKVDRPGREGRQAILELHARNKPVDKGVNFADLAARTPGLVGADMEAIMNEAAIYAGRAGADQITNEHLNLAIDKVIMGEQRSGTILSQKERISTAYHEGGHAVIAQALPSNGDVHKVTILPRGQALGLTWTAKQNDPYGYSKEDLLDQICMLMGGRAAEEICFGEITTGASNDIERATSLANRIVTEFAMDEQVGIVNLASPKKTGYSPSGELSVLASARVKDILDEQYDRAKDILNKNRAVLNDLSEGMLEHDELDKPEIDAIFGNRVPVERQQKDLEPYRNQLPPTQPPAQEPPAEPKKSA